MKKSPNILLVALLSILLNSCSYPSKTDNPFGLVEGTYKLKSHANGENDIFNDNTYFEFKYIQLENPKSRTEGLTKGQWKCNLIVQERKGKEIVVTHADYDNYVIEWHNSKLSQSDPTSIGGTIVKGHMGATSLLYNVTYGSDDYVSVWLDIETTDKSNDLSKRRVTVNYNNVFGSAVFENY